MTFQKPKWTFAIGHTSRVPNLGGMHYLIADFDDNVLQSNVMAFVCGYASHVIFQRTEHGWHMYTDLMCNSEQFENWTRKIGADEVWIQIGKERGYWFLADKSQLILPWQSECMVLHYEENAQNS